MPTKPYALIDTDSGDTIRYMDKRTKPPAGCKVVPTGYKPLTPYQKARRVARSIVSVLMCDMLTKQELNNICAAVTGGAIKDELTAKLLDHIAELEEQVSDLENQLTEVMERM